MEQRTNIAIIHFKIGELVGQETFNATWVVSKKSSNYHEMESDIPHSFPILGRGQNHGNLDSTVWQVLIV